MAGGLQDPPNLANQVFLHAILVGQIDKLATMETLRATMSFACRGSDVIL